MPRSYLPLNGLRAFEASARHLSLTQAAIELCVTQAAVSQQVKSLEQRLGVTLFQRLPRGLKLTAEGETLFPVLVRAFDQLDDTLARMEGGTVREPLYIGAVGTFAVNWLMPRLRVFEEQYPFIDIRLSTNNNRVDIAAEGLDFAIRFGDGRWHGTEAFKLFEAPLSALCVGHIAGSLHEPADIASYPLLRSYRADEWAKWFEAAKAPRSRYVDRTVVFDSSIVMMEAALQGAGIALAPPLLFSRLLTSGLVEQPFDISISLGAYWLTKLQSREMRPSMQTFLEWLYAQIAAECMGASHS